MDNIVDTFFARNEERPVLTREINPELEAIRELFAEGEPVPVHEVMAILAPMFSERSRDRKLAQLQELIEEHVPHTAGSFAEDVSHLINGAESVTVEATLVPAELFRVVVEHAGMRSLLGGTKLGELIYQPQLHPPGLPQQQGHALPAPKAEPMGVQVIERLKEIYQEEGTIKRKVSPVCRKLAEEWAESAGEQNPETIDKKAESFRSAWNTYQRECKDRGIDPLE